MTSAPEAENTLQRHDHLSSLHRQNSDSVSPRRVAETPVSPEDAVRQPAAYKLGHGPQRSKFVFSETELARCMRPYGGRTGPNCFYCVGSRGYVGIYYGPWYLVAQYVYDHSRWGAPDGPMFESVKRHNTEDECLDSPGGPCC